jgi:hypothetical protein
VVLTDDQLALRELVELYAAAVDERDEPSFVALWAPDARLSVFRPGDVEPSGVYEGADAMAGVIKNIARYDATVHIVANHRVRFGEPGATGETHCIAHHLRNGTDLTMFIRYVDAYTRRPGGGWRFASREVRILWTETVAVDGP